MHYGAVDVDDAVDAAADLDVDIELHVDVAVVCCCYRMPLIFDCCAINAEVVVDVEVAA